MGGSQSVEDGAKKKTDKPSPDGYEEPQIRKRSRQQPKRPEVLTDADVAAFDPTADKPGPAQERKMRREGARSSTRVEGPPKF